MAIGAAHGSEVLINQTELIQGSQSQTISILAPSAGEVSVTLEDLAWPTKLSALSFSASTASSVLKSSGPISSSEPYHTHYSVTGAGAFYAHISGVGQALPGFASLPDFGLYLIQVNFDPATGPVPLPASGWLLLMGAGALGVFGARRSRRAAPLPPAES